MISPEEAQEIRTDIALLKQSTSDTLKAIHEQSDSGKDLLQSVNELTVEIREDRARREAHDENREIQDNYVQEQIKSNTKRLDYFAEHYKQPVEKLITSQNRWDKFINAIFSKAGTTIFIFVIVAILYLLGVNPKDIKL
tara:strand:- start:20641 stop:21057 length:417 start_codon:yes stop_codon:yes gene_type:complete